MKAPRRAELRSLERRVVELEAENAYLREAARTFGDLAERLNEQLRAERRRGTEGRVRQGDSSKPWAVALKTR